MKYEFFSCYLPPLWRIHKTRVAAPLKTNVDYVHKLRKSGLLPFLKLGQYKVRKEALIEFLSRYEGKDLTNPFQIKELDYNGEN